jgi:acetolactate synthase-1/2/3 large subunit
LTVSEAFAEWLHEKGISHVFGVIGAGNLALYDAIWKTGKASIVCCHHEQASVMASTYFNRTRESLKSIALLTTGAGSTNGITGSMAAYMDSIPTMIVSGNERSIDIEGKTRVLGAQGFNTSVGVSSFCKGSFLINETRKFRDIDLMFLVATSGRPGPVWIDFSRDVQVADE